MKDSGVVIEVGIANQVMDALDVALAMIDPENQPAQYRPQYAYKQIFQAMESLRRAMDAGEYRMVQVEAYGDGWLPVVGAGCPLEGESCESRSGGSVCGGFYGTRKENDGHTYARCAMPPAPSVTAA